MAAHAQAGLCNDLSHPGTLIAVYNGANRAKGPRDPASWLPPNTAYRCAYVRAWLQVKDRWGLSMDRAETEGGHGRSEGLPGLIGTEFISAEIAG